MEDAVKETNGLLDNADNLLITDSVKKIGGLLFSASDLLTPSSSTRHKL